MTLCLDNIGPDILDLILGFLVIPKNGVIAKDIIAQELIRLLDTQQQQQHQVLSRLEFG
jgi:hypothetical protein